MPCHYQVACQRLWMCWLLLLELQLQLVSGSHCGYMHALCTKMLNVIYAGYSQLWCNDSEMFV